MNKISKNRHKHKSNEELQEMGLLELNEHLKKLLGESEAITNRIINPFKQ